MNILSKYKKISLSFLSSFTLIAMLFAGNVGVVSANSNNSNKEIKKDNKMEINLSEKSKPKTNVDIQINANGRMNLSGAKVVSVSGSSLVARLSFGSLNMDWTVETDSNTKLTRQKNGVAVMSDIKVGDVINVNGLVDTTATTPTVKATHIKDLTLSATLKGNLFQGKLVSLTSSTTPATAVLDINGTNYPVVIPSGISILGNNWLAVSLSSFQ